MKTSSDIIKYFLYARKSSESEDRQVQSIDDQINRLKELAKDLNLDVVETFTEAKSAKQPSSRPLFADMLNRIEKGEANGILCWQINRLSRNPVDSGRINWLLQQGVIMSIQTIDKQYLPEDNVLMFSVESGMANQFILDLRKNTKRGLEGKVERGWYPCKAPQGYLNDVISKTIIKDPERFDLIKKMWDLMLTGNYQVSKILEIVNDDWGYLTRKSKRTGGKLMSNSEIYRIFNDPFYYGYFFYNGKLYKGGHEPTITIDEFERVQELLGKKHKVKQKTHTFAFTGIIKCGYCGCLVTAEEKKKYIKSTRKYARYIYYRCTRRKREADCHQPVVKIKDLEGQIVREIEKYTIPIEFKDWALGVIKQKNNQEIESRDKAYEMLNKNYLELQKQLDNLTKLRLRELISDGEFVKERQDLQTRLTKARERLSQNQDRGQNWVDLVERAFNFAAYARMRFIATNDLQVKREILAALGQNFTLTAGQLIIEPMEWLVPISNYNKNNEISVSRLEPAGIGLHITQAAHCWTASVKRGGYRELHPNWECHRLLC